MAVVDVRFQQQPEDQVPVVSARVLVHSGIIGREGAEPFGVVLKWDFIM